MCGSPLANMATSHIPQVLVPVGEGKVLCILDNYTAMIYSFVGLFDYIVDCLFNSSLFYSFIYFIIYLFVYLFICLFIYLFIHIFIYLLVYLFIRSCISFFVCLFSIYFILCQSLQFTTENSPSQVPQLNEEARRNLALLQVSFLCSPRHFVTADLLEKKAFFIVFEYTIGC